MEDNNLASLFPDNRREQYLEKPLPSSEESERVILGAILLENAVIAQAVERLKPEDFYSPLNRRVFAAMIILFENQKAIDPILIGEELRKEGSLESIGGISTITNLTFGIPSFQNIEEYITIVKEKAQVRELIRVCNATTGHALSEEDEPSAVLDLAEERIYALREHSVVQTAIRMAVETGHAIENAKARKAAGNAMIGTPAGFSALDYRLQGFRKGQQIVLAARPSVGKTALGVRIGYNTAVKEGVPTLLVELEMTREEIADRIICAEANIDSTLLRSGFLADEQYLQAESIKESLEGGAPFFILDSPQTTLRTIRTQLRRLNTDLIKSGQPKIGILIVDHIGLMNNDTEKRGRNREQEVADISKGLKQIAREFELACVTLSQLNRQSENRSDHRPTLADLRESGAIEQDADVVMLLYRPDLYQTDQVLHTNTAEVIIAKNRSGPTGIVKLYFEKKSARFTDLAHIADVPEVQSHEEVEL